jgi:hypothetical protein
MVAGAAAASERISPVCHKQPSPIYAPADGRNPGAARVRGPSPAGVSASAGGSASTGRASERAGFGGGLMLIA